MNTTKKLLVTLLVALLAFASFMPSTFSWYSHDASSEGNNINYNGDLPISVKSGASTVTMKTYECNAKGEVADGASEVTSINLAKNSTNNAVKYYKTTFTNTGSNDVMVDFEASNFVNNADFVIGTTSPTLNEKAFASRASRNKVSAGFTRVYFKSHNEWASFWNVGNGTLGNFTTIGKTNGSTNDMNIAYKLSGEENERMEKMLKCKSSDNSTSVSTPYYFDVPSNAEYFYFFNHWYLNSATNREWNRTIDITDMSPGKLYYLDGGKVDEKWKSYSVTTSKDYVALDRYYDSVRMSMGSSVYADISLKKTSEDDENFIPEYYGKTITYATANSAVATVNKDGLITPHATGSTTITTTITGEFGDSYKVTTAVSIPSDISQVPIIRNLLVPAKNGKTASEAPTGTTVSNKVDVYWYALNKSGTNTMTTGSLFFTL